MSSDGEDTTFDLNPLYEEFFATYDKHFSKPKPTNITEDNDDEEDYDDEELEEISVEDGNSTQTTVRVRSKRNRIICSSGTSSSNSSTKRLANSTPNNNSAQRNARSNPLKLQKKLSSSSSETSTGAKVAKSIAPLILRKSGNVIGNEKNRPKVSENSVVLKSDITLQQQYGPPDTTYHMVFDDEIDSCRGTRMLETGAVFHKMYHLVGEFNSNQTDRKNWVALVHPSCLTEFETCFEDRESRLKTWKNHLFFDSPEVNRYLIPLLRRQHFVLMEMAKLSPKNIRMRIYDSRDESRANYLITEEEAILFVQPLFELKGDSLMEYKDTYFTFGYFGAPISLQKQVEMDCGIQVLLNAQACLLKNQFALSFVSIIQDFWNPLRDKNFIEMERKSLMEFLKKKKHAQLTSNTKRPSSQNQLPQQKQQQQQQLSKGVTETPETVLISSDEDGSKSCEEMMSELSLDFEKRSKTFSIRQEMMTRPKPAEIAAKRNASPSLSSTPPLSSCSSPQSPQKKRVQVDGQSNDSFESFARKSFSRTRSANDSSDKDHRPLKIVDVVDEESLDSFDAFCLPGSRSADGSVNRFQQEKRQKSTTVSEKDSEDSFDAFCPTAICQNQSPREFVNRFQQEEELDSFDTFQVTQQLAEATSPIRQQSNLSDTSIEILESLSPSLGKNLTATQELVSLLSPPRKRKSVTCGNAPDDDEPPRRLCQQLDEERHTLNQRVDEGPSLTTAELEKKLKKSALFAINGNDLISLSLDLVVSTAAIFCILYHYVKQFNSSVSNHSQKIGLIHPAYVNLGNCLSSSLRHFSCFFDKDKTTSVLVPLACSNHQCLLALNKKTEPNRVEVLVFNSKESVKLDEMITSKMLSTLTKAIFGESSHPMSIKIEKCDVQQKAADAGIHVILNAKQFIFNGKINKAVMLLPMIAEERKQCSEILLFQLKKDIESGFFMGINQSTVSEAIHALRFPSAAVEASYLLLDESNSQLSCAINLLLQVGPMKARVERVGSRKENKVASRVRELFEKSTDKTDSLKKKLKMSNTKHSNSCAEAVTTLLNRLIMEDNSIFDLFESRVTVSKMCEGRCRQSKSETTQSCLSHEVDLRKIFDTNLQQVIDRHIDSREEDCPSCQTNRLIIQNTVHKLGRYHLIYLNQREVAKFKNFDPFTTVRMLFAEWKIIGMVDKQLGNKFRFWCPGNTWSRIENGAKTDVNSSDLNNFVFSVFLLENKTG